MKKISVIVPIYNVEKYLAACLESLQKQEFDSYEVILVDDGSKDGSGKIAESYVEKYSDIFSLVHQENKGLSEARNTGMRYAKGEYLCFVDSDDSVDKRYLSELYQTAEDTGADMVFCAFQSVDENGNCLKKVFENGFECGKVYNIQERKDLLLIQNAAWNKLYKKKIIDDNQMQFTPGVWYEDLRFVKKYMLFASKCAYCDSILYNYLVRSGSIMTSMASKRNVEIIDAIDELTDFYKQKNAYEKYYQELEFLAIDHVYISALVRTVRAKDNAQTQYIYQEFRKRFSTYKKNKYLNCLERNKKIVFTLLNMKLYSVIRLIFEIKGGKRD